MEQGGHLILEDGSGCIVLEINDGCLVTEDFVAGALAGGGPPPSKTWWPLRDEEEEKAEDAATVATSERLPIPRKTREKVKARLDKPIASPDGEDEEELALVLLLAA